MKSCLNIHNKQVQSDLQKYEALLGSKMAAYAALYNNGGYTLDKTPNGEESQIYKQLLDKFNGDEKQAVLAKLQLYKPQNENTSNESLSEEQLISDRDRISQEINSAIDREVENSIIQNNQRPSLDNTVAVDISTIRAEASLDYAEQKQREIVGETQRQLAENFGLVRGEDGNYYSADSKNETAKLRVQFVNSLSNPGVIDFAHHLISISIQEGDCSTFNHELAHYYIRTFWNSRLIQNALDMCYVKEMGDYKHDEMAKIAVEEALADYLTRQTLDASFLTNIESRSYFQRFWEAFSRAMYKVFNIKNKTAKNAILRQCAQSFFLNKELENSLIGTKYAMHNGVMSQTAQQRIASRRRNTSGQVLYEPKSNVKNSILEDLIQNIVGAVQSKERSYRYRSNNSQLFSEQQAVENNELVRKVRRFVEQTKINRDIQNDANELSDKIYLIRDFIMQASDECDRTLNLFLNARANGTFAKVMYRVDQNGEHHYVDNNGNPISATNSNGTEQTREFTFDDLTYAAQDIIGFYDKTLNDIEVMLQQGMDFGLNDQSIQDLVDLINNSGIRDKVSQIKGLYNYALDYKITGWLDDSVDQRSELNDDFKSRLKINLHKWIKEQQDFGDISVLEKWVGMGSMSKSPVIRIIQDTIANISYKTDQEVDQKAHRLYSQLQKAKRQLGWKYRILPFNAQKFLLGLNKFGLPTGYLISRYNKGEYKQDLAALKDRLLFDEKEGLEKQLRELKDQNGDPLLKADYGEKEWKLELNQYGTPIVDVHTPEVNRLIKEKYLIPLEEYRCRNEIRQFTSKYYLERIRTLSIPALNALNEIDGQIQEITDTVTINNVQHLDMLSNDQQEKLVALNKQRSQLGSLTNLDGTYKSVNSVEYEIAASICDFNLKIRGKINYKTDWDAYKSAESHAKSKRQFHKNFTEVRINPKAFDIINNADDNLSKNVDETDPRWKELLKLKYSRARLISPYQGRTLGVVDFSKLFDKITGKFKHKEVFRTLHDLDESISKLTQELCDEYMPTRNTDDDFNEPSVFSKLLHKLPVPRDFASNPSASWQPSYDDSEYGDIRESAMDAINNSTMSPSEKIQALNELDTLMMYHSEYSDENVPLSIFSALLPNRSDYLFDPKDPTDKFDAYVRMPNNLFSVVDIENSDIEYVNKDYKKEDDLQLTDQWLDKRWDVIEANSELKKLYDMVVATMQESYDSVPFIGKYDGRASQIHARIGQMLGRNISWRNPKQLLRNIGAVLRRESEVIESDEEFRMDIDSGFAKRPDGSYIQNIPIRFVKMLDDPSYISSDVVGSVIQFYNMARNYNNKAEKSELLLSAVAKLRQSEESNYDSRKMTASQREIAEGILGRQVFEDKNSVTNNNEYLIQNEWNFCGGIFDWVRKYIINTPSGWVKRLGKVRAMTQLGMLAWNFGSSIVSFLDPLISVTIDVVTGKYINVKDFAYAAVQLFAQAPGAIASLGSAKQHTKINAAMQKFALSKRLTDSYRDLDMSPFMRFVTGGLSMKMFTLGDYTINSLNVISTMHNYRRFIDGSFLDKQSFLQKLQEAGVTYNDALSEYNDAQTMWDAYTLKDGEFVPVNPNDVGALEAEVFVKKQTQSRSSIYNGVVPNGDTSAMQTNIFASFATMLRNFIITGIWERFQTYDDFQVATVDNRGRLQDRNVTGVSERKRLRKLAKRNQHYYKGGLNFASRHIENGVDASFINWFQHIAPGFKYALYLLQHGGGKYSKENQKKLKELNLSQTDIYGLQKIFMEIAVSGGLLMCSFATNKYADDNKDSYWAQLLNLLTIRLYVERMTWFDISTLSDLVSSMTPAMTDIKRKEHIFDLIADFIGVSGDSLTDEVKQGKYRGQQRWKYHMINIFSSYGLPNLYTYIPSKVGDVETGTGGAQAIRQITGWYKGLARNTTPIVGNKVFPKKKKGSKSKKKSLAEKYK